MAVRKLLAVDLGASGGKCFVGTFDGGSFAMRELHRFVHEGTSFFLPDASGAVCERTYWDDTFIFRNIVEGLQAYRREEGATLDAIGVDTWGADGQFVTPDGDMLGKMYCYRDHRLDTMIEQVKARIDARRVYELTGIHFQPFNVSNQLLWFVLNRPDLMLPGITYLPVPAVFTYYLSGERAVDSSWASVTQLMDAKSREWSAEILEHLGVPLKVMPRIVRPGTVVAPLTEGLARLVGLNRAQVVAVAAHDTASAFAAAPVQDPATALIISSGTWSLVGKLVPQPVTTPEAMAANVSSEGGIDNIRLLKNCMGSWLVQELRRVWRVQDGKETSWDELTRLCEAAEPFKVLVDPDDSSFYNPANMQEAIDAFCARTGQAKPAGRGGYVRAVYESLALKYRQVNEHICRVSGSRTTTVHIVGGGCKNPLLNQFTADALGLPVLAGPEEATAVGNLMVQAMAMGIIRTMAEAQPLIKGAFPIREFKPENPAAWTAAYARFSKLAAAR
jgi:rhamnulokinase